MTLGEVIKEYRLSRDDEMSIRNFAIKSGLSASYICMLEKGIDQRGNVIAPTIQTIDKVAKAMNVSFDDVFNRLNGDVTVNSAEDDISQAEASIIQMYRSLSDNRKTDVFNYIKMLYDNE